MRTFTTTHTVYSFDELDDAAKEKAIEKQREFEYEYGLEHWLTDYMTETAEALLKKHGIKYTDDNLKIYYSLSYSQGDGAMFEGAFQWRGYEVAIKQAGMYYHYNSKSIYIETRYGNEAKQSVYDEFNELYVKIASELEKAGYDAIEDATSDETLADNIRDNEYEFYKDGSVV